MQYFETFYGNVPKGPSCRGPFFTKCIQIGRLLNLVEFFPSTYIALNLGLCCNPKGNFFVAFTKFSHVHYSNASMHHFTLSD